LTCVGAMLAAVVVALAGCAGTPDHPNTTVVWDTPYSTSSTAPVTIPALPSGVTAAQVKELLATGFRVPAEQWEVRDCRTFEGWAAAVVYARLMSSQMTHAGTGVVLRKKNGAWVFMGFVEPFDLARARAELTNMDASEEVRNYFAEVAAAAPEDVFLAELNNQEILFAQVLDECQGRKSLRYIDDISRRIVAVQHALLSTEAPSERTRQVADQLLRLVERLKSAADKATAGVFSQADFDSEVLLVTNHLPQATDNISRLLEGRDVTTTTASH
jgi:hypothetical protein